MAVSPLLTWWVMGAAAAAALGIGASLLLRVRSLRSLEGLMGQSVAPGSSFHQEIFEDRSGRERYIRLNMFLSGEKVIPWLPGAIIIGVWFFVWVVVILYGTLLYVWFSAVILILAFARPLDVFESFLIAGRILRSAPSEVGKEDRHLLAEAEGRMARGAWFFSGLGAWLACFVLVDYSFGDSVARWLTQTTGSLTPDQWRLSLFLFSVLATLAAAYLIWRPKDLDLEPEVAAQPVPRKHT